MKNLIRICLVLGLVMYVSSCAVEKPLKLNISNVSLDKKSFNPSQNERVKIRYRLSKEAHVEIKLYDSDDNLVRTLEPIGTDKKGYNERIWDGRNESGAITPKGVYIYTIEAKDILKKESYVYDMADETGGKELTLRELNFDYNTGQIDYVLPKAARLRIRIGIKDGGPLLKTLLNWEPKKAGRNSIKWNGMDSSNITNFLGNPNVFVNIAAFSLPENSIISEGEEAAFVKNYAAKKRPKKKTDIKKQMHALHERSKCHEPRFNFEVLGVKEDGNNMPIIEEDIVPVRITLDERDKMDLINSRFEIIFFMDNIFLFEEEEGTSPFTYRLNTKGLNEGEHILTVNLFSYEDHISGKSKRIFIRKER